MQTPHVLSQRMREHAVSQAAELSIPALLGAPAPSVTRARIGLAFTANAHFRAGGRGIQPLLQRRGKHLRFELPET